MVGSVVLSSQVRTNLAGVRNTQSNVDSTNAQLGTGTKIGNGKIGGGMSSHNEDSVTLIHSQALYNRASVFEKDKDGLKQGIDNIKTMATGIQGANGVVNLMKSYVNSMQTADTTQDRDAFQTALQETALQYDDMLADAKYNGQSFLNNEKASSTIQVSPNSQHAMNVQGIDISSNNPNIDLNGAITNASSGGDDFETAKDILDTASSTIKSSSIRVNAQESLLGSRKTFNEKYSEVMENSADNETDADQLKTATKLMASNVQNKLGLNSLALSAQQGAFVLNLVQDNK